MYDPLRPYINVLNRVFESKPKDLWLKLNFHFVEKLNK